MTGFKRISLLLLLGLCGVSKWGIAQDMDLVVRAGINLATVAGIDAGARNVPRPGLHLGGELGMPLDNSLNLHAGILVYSGKGTNNGNTAFRASYLEMPLFVRWTGDLPVQLIGGLQPAFLLRAYVNDGRGDITSQIRSVDMNLLLGAAYPFDENWLFGLRFAQGMLRVGKSGREQTYHSVVYLTAGYRL